MGTLSSLLDLSRNALQANSAALETISNNVANQNVAGYTKETVTLTSDVVTIGSSSIGTGVSASLEPVSQRDRVLEQRVQQQTQVSSQSDARQSALNQLQTVFGLSSTATSAISTTLGSAIDGLFNSFSALANAPGDASARQATLGAAGTLATAFQSVSNQVDSANAGLSGTAVTVVGEINGLTTTIASLNRQIGAQSPDKDAGILEDERQQAVAELSKYVGLDQTTTESNGLTLSTSNGTVLVAGNQSYALTGTASAGGVQITAAGSAVDIASTITGGQLGGIISVQQNDLPTLSNSLDQLAYAIGTAVNAANVAGVDGNGATGAPLFTLPGTATGAAHSIALATNDATKLAAGSTGEGTSGNTNANVLAGIGTSAIVGGQSAATYYAGVLSTLGTSVASATTDQTAQSSALGQLTTLRNSLSGVSLDEEAASLTQYQRSYQAASKLFSIVDTILEAAINLGTATTV